MFVGGFSIQYTWVSKEGPYICRIGILLMGKLNNESLNVHQLNSESLDDFLFSNSDKCAAIFYIVK